MFFRGAPRLVKAGLEVPGLQAGDRDRTVVESYPGVLARSVTKVGYKHDNPKKQTGSQRDARRRILNAVTGGELVARYGITVADGDPELVKTRRGIAWTRCCPRCRPPGHGGTARGCSGIGASIPWKRGLPICRGS